MEVAPRGGEEGDRRDERCKRHTSVSVVEDVHGGRTRTMIDGPAMPGQVYEQTNRKERSCAESGPRHRARQSSWRMTASQSEPPTQIVSTKPAAWMSEDMADSADSEERWIMAKMAKGGEGGGGERKPWPTGSGTCRSARVTCIRRLISESQTQRQLSLSSLCQALSDSALRPGSILCS